MRITEVLTESSKICPQCGMRGCTCKPGTCKCKPKPGSPKNIDEAANPAQQAAIAISKKEEVDEDWQKVNKKDKTDGMSKKAVSAYRRENPGSKLKTAVTTKPSKLKKGSKASKRRKSFCARSNGQKKMHNIDCSKTPDKAICAARRRWNCE